MAVRLTHAHLHMHTDEHSLLGEAGVTHSSTPPLLHVCSERSHPSRDQQTAVNPLLKILANPLGLLRIAKWTLCMPQIWNYAVKAVNGVQTPDPLSRHACCLGQRLL